MNRKIAAFLIVSMIVLLVVPTYLSSVSSSSGRIKINTTGDSVVGQTVAAGGSINLYFGGVTWSDVAFYLYLGQDNSPTMSFSGGTIYTPAFSIYDLVASTTTTYTQGNQTWRVGYNWVNGSLPQTIALGDYYIKAFDQISSVAVTDTYFTVNSIYYQSTLEISPPSGPGGVDIVFTGSNYPKNLPLVISYYDPQFGTWNTLVTTTSNATGQIQVSSQIPDLKKSVGSGDCYEGYTQLSYRVTDANDIVYSSATYNEYMRGLSQVGDANAYGLYGNGTSLISQVRVMTGDTITLSGKWFHSYSPIYIKWDGTNVVSTVTSDEWNYAQLLGTTTASFNGSFSATVQIPSAAAGEHYIAVEDSQTRITVKIFVSTALLNLSPNTGPGGASVQFTGGGYSALSEVTLSCRDPTYGTWSAWATTTADDLGRINFSASVPDLMKSNSNNEYGTGSSVISFRTEEAGVPKAYADFNQPWRGLNQVGPRTAAPLCGNGTDLTRYVNVTPGSTLFLSGSWFHPGVVYVRFDGTYVVDTVNGDQWNNAQIIGTTAANSNGSFATTVTIPSASGGRHYIAVEDSQTRITIQVTVIGPTITPSPTATPTSPPSSTPAPTAAPTSNPNLPTPSIDLTCKGASTTNGLKVTINGNLQLNGAALPETSVMLSYSVTDGDSWNELTLVKTASDGSFSAVWTPDVTGNYLIKAAVDATSTYRATNKVVTLALTPDQESNSIFTLNSNSTITQLSFDSESNELSFTASGPSNSHGYVEVYIPKTLIADITNLKTYIDGTPVSFNSQDQTDSWLITLTYSHSQHHITLQLSNNGQTPVQPPSSNWLTDNIILIAIAGVAIIIATAMTLAFKRSKPQK